MGDWSIVVRGRGPHHNSGNPGDANIITANLVRNLKLAGHEVLEADFLYADGARDDLSLVEPDSEKTLADRMAEHFPPPSVTPSVEPEPSGEG